LRSVAVSLGARAGTMLGMHDDYSDLEWARHAVERMLWRIALRLAHEYEEAAMQLRRWAQ
jgi:hypothetical protein